MIVLLRSSDLGVWNDIIYSPVRPRGSHVEPEVLSTRGTLDLVRCAWLKKSHHSLSVDKVPRLSPAKSAYPHAEFVAS